MTDMEVSLRLALGVVAAWRVTHLLAIEDGPAAVFARLRAGLGDGLLGTLVGCFYCLSLWVAAPIALVSFRNPVDVVLTWLGVSGAACLLERLNEQPVVIERDGGTP